MNLKELQEKIDESYEQNLKRKRLRKHIPPEKIRQMKREELEKKLRFETSMLIMLSVIFIMGVIKLIRG